MRSFLLVTIVTLLLGAAMAQNETEALFHGRCSRCHGLDGAGHTAPGKNLGVPDLRSPQVQKQSDDQLFQTIAYGRDHHNYPHVFVSMGVSEREVRSLVRYVRGLSQKK